MIADRPSDKMTVILFYARSTYNIWRLMILSILKTNIITDDDNDENDNGE